MSMMDKQRNIELAEWGHAAHDAQENWTVDPHVHIERLTQAGDALVAALCAAPTPPADPPGLVALVGEYQAAEEAWDGSAASLGRVNEALAALRRWTPAAPPETPVDLSKAPRCRKHGMLKKAVAHYFCEACYAAGEATVGPASAATPVEPDDWMSQRQADWQHGIPVEPPTRPEAEPNGGPLMRDGDERLMLNAYGRQCHAAGFARGYERKAAELATRPETVTRKQLEALVTKWREESAAYPVATSTGAMWSSVAVNACANELAALAVGQTKETP